MFTGVQWLLKSLPQRQLQSENAYVGSAPVILGKLPLTCASLLQVMKLIASNIIPRWGTSPLHYLEPTTLWVKGIFGRAAFGFGVSAAVLLQSTSSAVECGLHHSDLYMQLSWVMQDAESSASLFHQHSCRGLESAQSEVFIRM